MPAHLLCEIKRHIMKRAVVTPAGHRFERETIELWLERQGPVCPISGAALSADDLKDDLELQREISEFSVKRAVEAMRVADDAQDAYDFSEDL